MQGLLPVSLFAIFTLHFLGLRYDWYGAFLWYDIPMHIAGGVWVAAAFFYFSRRYEKIAKHLALTASTTFNVFAIVLVVGVGWEMFEYAADIHVFGKYTWFTVPGFILADSAYDLINDLIGGALVSAYAAHRVAH